jgi:hypothetical protein
MRIHTKAARGLAMGTARTPWVPHAALSWIIRKGHLARWHWSSAGSSPLIAPFLFPMILAVGLKFAMRRANFILIS